MPRERWIVSLTSVDVTGSSVILDFRATDEDGLGVANLFDSDGRFNLARLVDGVNPSDPDTAGDPTDWQGLLSSERFTTTGSNFQNLGGGDYRYTSVFDPTTIPVATDDTLRVAVQISASDLPAGNGWCDFEADLAVANGCDTPPSLTRDIVQTATCNGCHGVTSDTKLAFHGGARTEVEYCVTCHNPGIGETDMTNMTHKIHYGADLTQDFREGEYSHVEFTRDIDNCTSCHTGGGADEDNWKDEPNRTSCGSCHDDVNFDTGENHGSGGPQPNNRFCANCHPASGAWTGSQLPVSTVHQGVARAEEAGLYRNGGNGYSLDAVSYDRTTDQITVDFSVTRDGQKMTLQSDPRWSNGARLAIQVAWSTEEYTNEGSGSTPAPAQPVSVDALDVGGAVSDLGAGRYRAVIDTPSGASGNLTVAIEGHPQADLQGNGNYESIQVRSVFADVNIELRESVRARRRVIDIDKCNACHDTAGAGLSLHGDNRAGEMQVCVLCHNNDATDIRQRPADPSMAIDGKREESVDIKRMIHQIHAGKDLEEGLVIYGFGGFPHDYSFVGFVGNNRNCLTCHLPGTYSTDAAWTSSSSTVDTGDDVTDPSDDLNISPVTAVCSSCHDTGRAKQHMVLNGGTFGSFDKDIAVAAVPEPGGLELSLVALGSLGALARRRFRQLHRVEVDSGPRDARDESRRVLRSG